MIKVFFDENGLRLNSKLYTGECLDCDISDIGRDKFDGKVLLYPGGKYQIVKASQPVFRVPIPGVLPNNRPKIHPDWVPEPSDNGVREDNILRSLQRMQQIILCNTWDYFVTFTFDDSKIDAANIELVTTKTQKWLDNLRQRHNIGYLLVPEYHKKNKRVHMHALISGSLDVVSSGAFGVEGLNRPVLDTTIKRYHLENMVKYEIFNVKGWKYGFSTAISVYGSPGRLANYVLKYITKGFEEARSKKVSDTHYAKEHKKIFGKNYWCSRNLQLYPVTELYKLDWYEFRDTPGREYYHRGSEASYKYINRLGDALEEMSDDELVIDTR